MMKTKDYRFNTELFKSFIGKNLNKYKHKKFLYTHTVTMFVGFMVDNVSYEISNDFKEVDYFGWDDEATVCRVSETPWSEILNGEDDICETSLNQNIIGITIINDCYTSKSYGNIDYEWKETRAIIFKLANTELMFEKQDCFFSMEIEIRKGHNLIDTVDDGKKILDDFEQTDKQTIEVQREIIELN